MDLGGSRLDFFWFWSNKLVSELTLLSLILEMGSTKLEVEKFTDENDFHLWRLKMRALLVHQGLDEALGE